MKYLYYCINSGEENLISTNEAKNCVAISKGVRFAIREGGRTVGAGQVTEIIE